MEGGVILTDRDDLGQALGARFAMLPTYNGSQTLRLAFYALALSLLTHPRLFWLPKAIPFLRLGETIFHPEFPLRRLGGLQAGLARHWQRKLQALQGQRRAAVECWHASPVPGLAPACADRPKPLLRFPLLLDNTTAARRLLADGERQGLGIAPSYPDGVHRLPELSGQFTGQAFPAAEDVARRLVTLPVHGYLQPRDRARILALFSRLEEARP